MSFLGGLARFLFRAGSVANTANVLKSGRPRRIAKHAVRRRANKATSKAIRRIVK